MRVLAVDPGKSCGISLIDHDGSVIFTATADIDRVDHWFALAADKHPTHIAMESPPRNVTSQDHYWYRVRDTLLCYFANPVTKVSPGAWKPLRFILSKPGDEFKTNHEKDATFLARYVLRKVRR